MKKNVLKCGLEWPKTSKEYVHQHSGCICPMCGSSNISAENIDGDGTIATSNVECHECGAYWTDVWALIDYDNLNDGMTLEELEEVEKRAKVIRQNRK